MFIFQDDLYILSLYFLLVHTFIIELFWLHYIAKNHNYIELSNTMFIISFCSNI